LRPDHKKSLGAYPQEKEKKKEEKSDVKAKTSVRKGKRWETAVGNQKRFL